MKPFYWALIIFVLAAVFRLTFLDLIEFKLDEARDVYEMVNFFRQPHLFQLGPIQSTGVYNPPLWYYFLSILSLPSRDPQYLSFMIALINSLAVSAFYLVVRQFYGHFTGLVAAIFLAFSPWAILFSRKIWAPDLILPLMVAIFYFLHKKNFFWLALLLSLLAQLHASGLFLAVGTILMLIILHLRGVKAHLGGVLVGLILGLIPLLPYIAYQMQNGCPDCQSFFSYQGEEKQFDTNHFLRPFQFLGGSSFQLVLGEDYEIFLAQFPIIKFFNILFLFEFLLGILGIIYIIVYKTYTAVYKLSTVGWAAVVPVLYLITQTPAYMHYFLILAPFSILIYALGLTYLRSVSKNLWIPAFAGMTVVIINIIFNISLYQFLSQKQNIQGDYGPIFKLNRQVVEEKTQNAKGLPDYELIKAETYLRLFMGQQ